MWRACRAPSMAICGSPAQTYSPSPLEWASDVTCVKEPQGLLITACGPSLMALSAARTSASSSALRFCRVLV